MPNRIIKESICTSADIDKLTPEEEIFFYRLIVNCDDYGRLDARLPILKAKCFPLRSEKLTDETIKQWIGALVNNGKLITVYEVDGKHYLQMNTWEKHQQIRAKKSKFPSIDDGVISIEYNGYPLQSFAPVIQSNPILKESNPKGSPRRPVKEFTDDSIEMKLAVRLKDKILKNNPKAKTPDADGLKNWAAEFDRMIRIDKRTPLEITSVIDFCQSDPFWMSNVLSAKKLREKFDTLFMQSKTKGGNYGGGKNGGIRQPGDQQNDDFEIRYD